MTCDAAALDDADADFQRWFFGGSPPEHDDWDRHAFADALTTQCVVMERLDTTRLDSGVQQIDIRERLAA